jgi:hypothetical protein
VRNIGIDISEGLVYELDGFRGHPVWPMPVITKAKFVYPSQDPLEADASMNILGYRFREDSFDPISRIRRGRFYRTPESGSLSQNCTVANHPARPFEGIAHDIHGRSKQLDIFYGDLIWQNFLKGKREKPLVLLGIDERFTVWSIVNIEAISTGEDLVTLKGRNSFGLLPSLNEGKIPEKLRAKLVESLDTFADEIHRSSPTSVVDRARDVATYVLLAYLDVQGADSKDLGTLIKRLEGQELVIASSSATIINRLHARGKAVEQEKRALRPIREEDAELVTHCVGNLLCELGMAEWA